MKVLSQFFLISSDNFDVATQPGWVVEDVEARAALVYEFFEISAVEWVVGFACEDGDDNFAFEESVFSQLIETGLEGSKQTDVVEVVLSQHHSIAPLTRINLRKVSGGWIRRIVRIGNESKAITHLQRDFKEGRSQEGLCLDGVLVQHVFYLPVFSAYGI